MGVAGKKMQNKLEKKYMNTNQGKEDVQSKLK